MSATSEELDALRRRVAALEARLARLGRADDDVHPCVRTREVQLHGSGEDGERVVRGRLHTARGTPHRWPAAHRRAGARTRPW